MIAGVLTGPGPGTELDLLRTRPQRTLLSLAIPTYNVIYRAFVSTTLVDNDNVISVAFDGGGGGALANVLPGMTLLVGNGLSQWDAGIVRIRDYIDSGGGVGYFLIGIASDIEWIDGLFLTVVDEYGLWPKHPFINPITHVSYMDYDIAYNLGAPGLDVKQNEYGAPVPILGSHVVLELIGANVTTTFDANQSYSCINAPTSYTFAWSCPDPTVTFTAPAAGNTNATFISAGTYIIYLSVTANYAGGYSAESIAVRYVIVHDAAHPLNTSFALENCSGSYDEGGWSYRVTMNANATELIIRDRTLCILVAKDWYGATEQSIGPLVGRENIVCVGWIDGESLRRSNDKSTVSFDVQGPAWWLGVQEGFPTGIDDTDVAPVDWLHIQALDPRKGLFAFLHWRTTATTIMDCYITDDDHRLATTYTPAGSLAEQLRAIAERINARAVCNRYGQLFCVVDTQFITPLARTFPIVQTLTDRDWRDEITIERHEVAEAGQVDLSGVHFSGVIPLDATTYSVFSLSPGHYPKHYGSKYKVENIALDDQAEADLIVGLWLGFLNNEYPNIDTPMSSNYRAVDIAPRMFVWMNMAVGDTPRGIVFTTKQLIPREVSFGYDEREALLLTDITFEAETFPGLAVTGDPPINPPDGHHDPPIPPLLCNDPLALNFGGPLPCIYRPLTDVVIVFTATQLARSMDFYGTLPPTWESVKTSGLAGANVGTIVNCVVALNATAWALTYKDGATLGDNGVFYCPDILAATPTWNLIYTLAAYNGLGYVGWPHALGVDINNVFYIQSWGTVTKDYGYGTSTVTWVSPASVPGVRDCINSQHSVGVVSGARGSHCAAPCPGKTIITMDGAANALVLFSTNISDVVCVTGNHVIETGGGDFGSLQSYTDSPVLNGSTIILIYTGADWRHGIVSDGGNVLTVRNVDTFLMNLAVPIADPAVAFGAARDGGGFCFGLAGYGEIIWVAQNAGATSAFIALRDTGGGWTDKTGDFNTAIGAWAGYVSGTMPAPMTLSV